MIAQDTGSAINGPARADLYWGAGDKAGRIAGRIRQQGQFVMLLPRELDMVEAGKHTPLPSPKPTMTLVAKAEAKNATQAKAETGTSDDSKRSLRRSHQPPEPIARRQARIRTKSGT
jgi:membrane-bound lytic murein transglycosylase A